MKTGPLSDEHRKKLSEVRTGKNNPFYGRKHSEETKRKISESRMGKKNPNYGKTPWNKGKKCPSISRARMGQPSPKKGIKTGPLSEDHKRKISEGLRGADGVYYKKGRSYVEMYGFEKAEEIKEKIRKKRLKQVISAKDTIIEIVMQKELDRRNIVYETHIPVCGVCVPDIVFLDKKVTVECDGDYWHRLPDMVERDKRQNKVLRGAGWRVLRFWGSEIREDVSRCIDVVEGVLG